jgi:cob(I)alamin adenosyltransferase
VVDLKQSEGLASDAVLRYLNRASDFVYAMARFADTDDPELFQGREGAES